MEEGGIIFGFLYNIIILLKKVNIKTILISTVYTMSCMLHNYTIIIIIITLLYITDPYACTHENT